MRLLRKSGREDLLNAINSASPLSRKLDFPFYSKARRASNGEGEPPPYDGLWKAGESINALPKLKQREPVHA